MVSFKVDTHQLQNTLIIIDEPEASLHPSAARHLRDGLIRISKANSVVYGTHSIFMIDSSNIGRHLIVKKRDEVTGVETAGESNLADEEVLYNALGYSLYEILKEKNLIFEGWNDKHLFQIATNNKWPEFKEKFDDVGACHAHGVGTIKNITPLIELAHRECLILSDGDKPAKDQRNIYTKDKGFGDWKTYQDIDPTITASTGEDFVKNQHIAECVTTVLSDTSMSTMSELKLPEETGKVAVISKWLVDRVSLNRRL